MISLCPKLNLAIWVVTFMGKVIVEGRRPIVQLADRICVSISIERQLCTIKRIRIEIGVSDGKSTSVSFKSLRESLPSPSGKVGFEIQVSRTSLAAF